MVAEGHLLHHLHGDIAECNQPYPKAGWVSHRTPIGDQTYGQFPYLAQRNLFGPGLKEFGCHVIFTVS